RGPSYQFTIAPNEAQFRWCVADVADEWSRTAGVDSRAVRMLFLGANPTARVAGEQELPGRINYLIGRDSSQWKVGLSTFARVRVEGLYPGIDLLYHGSSREVEYDFEVAPGSDPKAIAIQFEGADSVRINEQGELILRVGVEQ